MTDNASEFSVSAADLGRDAEFARPGCGPCCSLAIVASLLLLSICALGWSPPDWIQPSIVGLLWANLFLLGLAAGHVRRGSARFACLAGGLLWLSKIALTIVTDLSTAECLLLGTILCGAGWSVAHLDNLHRDLSKSYSSAIQYQQWTIWDIALLTTFVAAICFSTPRLESPGALLLNVTFVLTGGIMCSWLAYRWVFDDQWNVVKLLAILSVCALSLGVVSQLAPAESTVLQSLAWMLTGPLAVIAAQGLGVLAILSAIRVDQARTKSNAKSLATSSETPALRIYTV